MDELVKLGKKVKYLRKKKKYNQEYFSTLCKLDRTYISGFENGHRNISFKNLLKIAKALEVELKELFSNGH